MNTKYDTQTFSKQILDFYFSLEKDLPLPNTIETIYQKVLL